MFVGEGCGNSDCTDTELTRNNPAVNEDVSTRRSLSTAYRYQRNATIGLYNISFVPDEDLRG